MEINIMKSLMFRIIAVIVLLMTLLSSCESSYAIDSGHSARVIGLIPKFAIGVRSKTNEFDIDNVTLDFSWGKENGIDEGDCVFIDRGGKGVMPEECPVFCVAVYFCNYDYVDRLNIIHHYGDYKEIEDVYFVKDFTVKEFNEECKADYSYWGRTKYDHTETLTIPQEVFENAKGVISFFVTEIMYIPSENAYMIYSGCGILFEYEFLKDGKVRIGMY